jgi:hypothetical protein
VRPVAVAIALAAASLPWGARAIEHEQHVGVDGGMSILVLNDKTDVGGALGGHWAYGLSDVFNIMAEATWSLVALNENVESVHTPRTRPTNVANLGAGMAYVFDVLSWVPYAGVLLGGYALFGGTIGGATILPGATAAVGLDYRLQRQWVVGVAFRQHFLFTDMTTYPSFTHILARLEYTWGW